MRDSTSRTSGQWPPRSSTSATIWIPAFAPPSRLPPKTSKTFIRPRSCPAQRLAARSRPHSMPHAIPFKRRSSRMGSTSRLNSGGRKAGSACTSRSFWKRGRSEGKRPPRDLELDHPYALGVGCALDFGGNDLFRQRRRKPLASTDRKSTRLNSSHGYISYAVFCLKKKKTSSTRYSYTLITQLTKCLCR